MAARAHGRAGGAQTLAPSEVVRARARAGKVRGQGLRPSGSRSAGRASSRKPKPPWWPGERPRLGHGGGLRDGGGYGRKAVVGHRDGGGGEVGGRNFGSPTVSARKKTPKTL